MIVYKAIKRDHEGKLSSTFAFGKAEKYYRQGVNHHAPYWLADKGYHLIAFKSLKRAMAWGKPRGTEVWECEATGIIPYTDLPQRLYIYSLSSGDMNPSEDGAWPKDTIMCKTIKLLKEVT